MVQIRKAMEAVAYMCGSFFVWLKHRAFCVADVFGDLRSVAKRAVPFWAFMVY